MKLASFFFCLTLPSFVCFGEFRSDNMQKVTPCLAVAGRGGPVQLPGHDAVLSPGNPNVGHTPSGSARRQRESHTLFAKLFQSVAVCL